MCYFFKLNDSWLCKLSQQPPTLAHLLPRFVDSCLITEHNVTTDVLKPTVTVHLILLIV